MQFQHSSYLSYPATATGSPITQGNNSVPTTGATGAPPNTLQYSLDQQRHHHHHMGYTPPTMPHGYPTDGYPPHQSLIPPPFAGTPRVKPKRKQVKNACVNCQKACKKCDDARPCPRCVKYGITATCVNSVRKERKKGVKRGPYKQRKGQDGSDQGSSEPATPIPATLSVVTPPTSINGANSSLLLNHASPYIRSFHDPAVSGNQEGYPSHGAIVPPYGMMQQMYSTEYNPSNHQTPLKQNQHQQPQQQATATPASIAKYKGSSPAGADSDEEGSKLNILSQLCSAVLDHSDTPPKEEGKQQDQVKKELYGNNNSNGTASMPSTSHGYQHPASSSTRAPQHMTYVSNGHHSYTTQQQQSQQQHLWPLPPLQSVVPSDRNVYYHPQQQQQQQQPPQQQQQQQFSFQSSSLTAQQQQSTSGDNQWNGSQW
ncbi:hypothetical protein BX666DRAFT_1979194 [Dichotomocladium elegans]|nr:hypothetical protein BX666DRAFT_1979194 [Dichotomocladium elegans]